jgi:hypothetical protein
VPNSVLTGARYPASSASPNVPQDIQNAVLDLEDNTTPSYANSGARDTAFTNWVSAGNTMRDGLACYVQGTGYMEYHGTTWVAMHKTQFRRVPATASGTLASGGSADLCTAQSIPVWPFGAGVNYWLDVDASCHVSALPAGEGVKIELLYDGVMQDGDIYSNGGASSCQYTLRARSGMTIGDSSAHTIRAVVTNLAGGSTLTLDTTYGRLLITMRPFVAF